MNVCKKCGKTTAESLINEMCKECYDKLLKGEKDGIR